MSGDEAGAVVALQRVLLHACVVRCVFAAGSQVEVLRMSQLW